MLLIGVQIVASLASPSARPSASAPQAVTGASSCVPPPPGLVSWWRGEGNGADFTGRNNGNLQGGIAFPPGEVGQAFNFNGSSQYVRIPSSPSLNPSGSFTIDVWIYPTADVIGSIVAKWGDTGDYNSQRSYYLRTGPGAMVFFGISDDVHQSDSSFHDFKTNPNAITLNTWNHVAAVYDQGSGTRSIFINGVLAVTRTDPPITLTKSVTDVAIGASLRASTTVQDYFPGLIDEVDFFNRALSASDIHAIYAAGPAGKCTAVQTLAPISSFSARGPFSDGAPITFVASGPAGAKIRVQFSTDPNIKTDGNESSWTDLFDGGVMNEDPNSPGNYALVTNAYPTGSGIYFRAIASRQGFTDSVIPASAYLGPNTLHAKPGLSPTTFTVNGNTTPAAAGADTVLRFAATQSTRPAGLRVQVQASIDGSTWNDLPQHGSMTYDFSTGQFVLNTNNYPQSSTVSFRAISSAPGFDDTISNPVGPFNLSSSKARLNPVDMSISTNGWFADFYCVARIKNLPSGGSVRVQSTTTPSDESSWSDLNIGNSGHMSPESQPNVFSLTASNLSSARAVYFRSVASASGYVDSFSVATGPFDIQALVPATVTIAPSGSSFIKGSGVGSVNSRIQANPGPLSFHVTANLSDANRSVKEIGLLIDGELKTSVSDGSASLDYTTSTLAPGDHTVSAFVIDDRGALARTTATDLSTAPKTDSTGSFLEPFYLHIRQPGDSHALAERGVTSSSAATIAGKTYTCVRDGHWATDSTWADSDGNPGHPDVNDTAIIKNHLVVIDPTQGDFANTVITSLTVDGGRNGGLQATSPCTVTVGGIMTIISGNFNGPMDLVITTSGLLEAINQSTVFFNSLGTNQVRIINSGKLNIHGSGGFAGLGTFDNEANLTFQLPVTLPQHAGTVRPVLGENVKLAGKVSAGPLTPLQLVTIDGKIVSTGGNNILLNGGANVLSNSVLVVSHDGGSIITDNGSGVISNDGSTLLSENGGGLISNDGSSLISNDGSSIVAQGGGNFISHNGSGSRAANTPAEIAATGIDVTGGELNLSACTILGDLVLDGGTLSGSGLIQGNLVNNGGYIMPGGGGTGTIAVTGNFAQASNGTIVTKNGGSLPGQFDRVQVGGTASLGGKLDIKTVNGYTPGTQDLFAPLGFTSATGGFSQISSNSQASVDATGVVVSLDTSKPNPKSGQPLNIATRLAVQGGDNLLIAGFIITGPSGSTKTVLVRGIGPSLANAGVANPLTDPLLELHEPDGTVVVNDNWQQGDTSKIPNAFVPSDTRESVIVATLAPGNYSALVKGAHGETGIGVAEVYDLDSGSSALLGNIATRGFVNTGDNVLIGGFIVGGTEPAKMLVRAIGPSLSAFGVQGALPATTLELHDSNGAVISNDGWRSTQEAEIKATTIPPSDDNEAAILATLPPGNYTAVVRGKDNTTGIGLVEAYNLP